MDTRIALAKLNKRYEAFRLASKKGNALADYLLYITNEHPDFLRELEHPTQRPSNDSIPKIIDHGENIQSVWTHLQLINNYICNDDVVPEEYYGDFTDDLIILHQFITDKLLEQGSDNSNTLPKERLLRAIPDNGKNAEAKKIATILVNQVRADNYFLTKCLKGNSNLRKKDYQTRINNRSRSINYNDQIENRIKTINRHWKLSGFKVKFTRSVCEITAKNL